MIHLETVLRTAVRELADEGRPVDLGERALAGLRRRHRRAAALAAFAVAAVAAGALAWPHWATSIDPPPVTPPGDPLPSATAEPWPTFAGLGRVPAAPPGSVTDRFVVAAYLTNPNAPRGIATYPEMLRMHVLDPTTGQYRQPGVDNVLALSPDLRYAVVTREHVVREEAGGAEIGVDEYGIYDTAAGHVLGRLGVEDWVNPLQGRVAWHASWSPDGRSLVLSVRLALSAGRGWLAEKLLFVDVLTGAIRAVDIHPTNGLEPLDLLGWTADGTAIALAADRSSTDEVPTGHLLYNLAGRPLAAHPWPGQSIAVPAARADQLALIPMSRSDKITVMGLSTGVVQHRYPAGPLSAVPGSQNPLAWRDGELVVPAETCTSDGCVPARQVLGVAAASGQSRVLHTLDELPVHMVVAPAAGLAGPAAALAW